MSDVRVVPTPDGKFKVLVNFIQQGIEYGSKALAESEASKIKPVSIKSYYRNK